jgi:hypothetical protein
MMNAELAQLNAFPDEVNVQLDVLGALVMNWIRRHVDGGDVVAEYYRDLRDGTVELAEELSEPDAFGRGVRHSAVFRFRARSRHGGLSPGRPGHEGVAEVHTEAGRRSTGLWAYFWC